MFTQKIVKCTDCGKHLSNIDAKKYNLDNREIYYCKKCDEKYN